MTSPVPPYVLICTSQIKACTIEDLKNVFSYYGKLYGDGIVIPTSKKDIRILIKYETVGSVMKAFQALHDNHCPELSCRLKLQYSRDTKLKMISMGLLEPSASKLIMPVRMPPGPVRPTTAATTMASSSATSTPVKKSISLILKKENPNDINKQKKIMNTSILKENINTLSKNKVDSSQSNISLIKQNSINIKSKQQLIKNNNDDQNNINLPKSNSNFNDITFSSNTELDLTENSSPSSSSSCSSSSSSSSCSVFSSDSSPTENVENSSKNDSKKSSEIISPLKSEFMKILENSALGPLPVPTSQENDLVNIEKDKINKLDIKDTEKIKKKIKKPKNNKSNIEIENNKNQIENEKKDIKTTVITNMTIQNKKKIQPKNIGRKIYRNLGHDDPVLSLIAGGQNKIGISIIDYEKQRLKILGLIEKNNIENDIFEAKEHLSIHSSLFSIDPEPVGYEIEISKNICSFLNNQNGKLSILVPTIIKPDNLLVD